MNSSKHQFGIKNNNKKHTTSCDEIHDFLVWWNCYNFKGDNNYRLLEDDNNYALLQDCTNYTIMEDCNNYTLMEDCTNYIILEDCSNYKLTLLDDYNNYSRSWKTTIIMLSLKTTIIIVSWKTTILCSPGSVNFLTYCVFWFVFLNASSHLCFGFLYSPGRLQSLYSPGRSQQ